MFSVNNITPVVKNLIIINALMFVGTLAIGDWFYTEFALYYPDSTYFQPLQLITHMFMHGGLGHIFFNMLTLFFFGPSMEMRWGPKKFLGAFLLMGLGGAILHLGTFALEIYNGFGTITPFSDTGSTAPGGSMVGASGAIQGIMAAFAFTYPRQKIYLMFIPFGVEARFLVPGLMVYELIAANTSFGADNIAHYAHIGGAAIGVLLAWMWRYSR